MKLPIAIAVTVGVIAAGFLFLYAPYLFPSSVGQQTHIERNLYANGTYGISFSYPSDYVLQEGERGIGEERYYTITLIHEKDTDIPLGGEGPTAITFDFFKKENTDSLEAWIVSHSESNYALGDRTLMPSMVGEADALSYRWSGLYEGISTAFIQGEYVVIASVTWLTPEDEILRDYEGVLGSVTLTPQ